MMNHSGTPLPSLEETLRQVDPGAPPADLAARCMAALPDNPPPGLLARTAEFLRAMPRRRQFVGVATVAALIVGALWTTWPAVRPDGSTRAAASAFAQTVSAMAQITAWSSVGRQITFDPGDGKTRFFRYRFDYGWSESRAWFDAKRGFYDETPNRDGVITQRSLLLSNGDWYYRHTDAVIGYDKVRVTHKSDKSWYSLRDDQLKNLRNPASLAENFGNPATAPPTRREGRWQGQPAVVFTFDVPPAAGTLPTDPPTLRTEIYVDPETRLIRARRQFARWPSHPERGEHVTWIQEFQYTDPDAEATAARFDAQQFCKGAKEIQERDFALGISLDPD